MNTTDVKAHGAVGDGVTDDTAAFETALNFINDGGICYVPDGVYLIAPSGIKRFLSWGQHLVGAGSGSILKIAGPQTSYGMFSTLGNGWSIEDLVFDMAGYVPDTRRATLACNGDNWVVKGCKLMNFDSIGIRVAGGNNWTIKECHIEKAFPDPAKLNVGILCTTRGDVRPSNIHILDNKVFKTSIGVWGFKGRVERNVVKDSGYGTGIFTGQPGNADTLEIRDNECSGGRGLDENKTWVTGFELWAPNSVIEGNVAFDNDGAGIIVGGKNCIVIGNHCYDNSVHAPNRAGIAVRHQNADITGAGSVLIGNRCNDTRFPDVNAMTQCFGYMEQPGMPPNLVTLIGNNFTENKIRDVSINQ